MMTECEELNNKANGAVPDCPEIYYINHGEEDEMEVHGYRRSPLRTAVTWLCTILTAGFLRLVFHWCPQWMLYATCTPCELQIAERLLFRENYQGKYNTYHIKNVKTLVINGSSCKRAEITGKRRGTKPAVHIHLNTGMSKYTEQIRAVWVKKLCYVWDESRHSFIKLYGLDKGVMKDDFHHYKGYSTEQQLCRRSVYGLNEIAVPLQSIFTLFVLEVINPFYIFQIFTLIVWICEEYYYYTGAIIVMSVFGVTSSIIQTRRNQRSLHDTVHSTEIVRVCREDNTQEDIPANLLVPGDVIVIPSHGCTMQCDAVLLNGSCIVNEGMLTGESVPITKTALQHGSTEVYNDKDDASHTLFCGTKVIQTRYYGDEHVKAVVLRTGYLTAKGSLVRSILYPPPADFKFEQDTYKFIGILALIAVIGVLYTVVSKAMRALPAKDVVIKALDIITIVIPPALPATMTMGKLYGQQRLQAAKIYCINSRVINVSGSLDCVCFDKTGTLTEDGLDTWGVIPVANNRFQLPVKKMSGLPWGRLMEGMACCHSITYIDDQMSGDPLDVKVFQFTGWQLEEPSIADSSKFDVLVPTVVKPPTVSHFQHPGSKVPSEIAIIHQFQFSSSLQRMSVITRELGSQNFIAFCKGSPEMILSLSKPSTVPEDIASTLKEYTVRGYRVIALGWKMLNETSYVKVQRLPREEVENDLTFVGLIILENRLKPQTKPTIHELKNANIRTIMITGDNIQTAISVAKECGIIEPGQRVVDVTAIADASPKVYFTEATVPTRALSTHGRMGRMKNQYLEGGDIELGYEDGIADYIFAITGNTWTIIRENMPELIPKLVTRGAVFARMSSEQKQQVVIELKELGYYVAMCGDGANDCGALKAAHAGISLCEAEASVASPFTSREGNISCVPIVIREGRAALVTSFGIFKFMVLYSLTEFLSTAILYAIDSNLTDFQFLFIDIFLIVNFAFTFGKTEAYPGPLVRRTPTTSLYTLPPLASMVLQMIVIITIQIISFFMVQNFPWFKPHRYDTEYPRNYSSYENYAVYTVSMFQYIISAVVFSHGAPYRKSIFTNYVFLASLVLMTIVCVYITLYPATWITTFLELMLPDEYNFRIIVLCLATVNFCLALFIEMFLVQYIVSKKLPQNCYKMTKTQQKYLAIEEELQMNTDWPCITNELPSTQRPTTTSLPHRSLEISLEVISKEHSVINSIPEITKS